MEVEGKKNEILEKTIKRMKGEESKKEETEKIVLKIELDFIKEAVDIKHTNALLLKEVEMVDTEKSILQEKLE